MICEGVKINDSQDFHFEKYHDAQNFVSKYIRTSQIESLGWLIGQWCIRDC